MKKGKFIILNIIITLVISLLVIVIGGNIIAKDLLKDVEEKQTRTVSTVESDIEEVYDNSVDGVVYIETDIGSGSGFIYKFEDDEAYILTNYHVIDDHDYITITTNDGELIEDVEFLGGDEVYDLAVLRATRVDSMIQLPIKETPDYSVGENVLAIGSPMGEDFMNTATLGIVSGKDRFLEVDAENNWGLWLIQTDTAINPGNSGGPLFTMDGEVIGINTMKFVKTGVESMGFAIPMDSVIPKLDAFENGKSVRPTLGITLRDTEDGVEVRYVSSESSAGHAGIERGDIILKIGKTKIDSADEVLQVINGYLVGDVVEFTIERDGEEMVIEVELEQDED